MTSTLIAIALLLAAVLGFVWSKLRAARRADYIRTYTLPKGLFERLRKRRPELTLKDCQLVSRALRQFFLAYLKSGCKFVSMPSQVADDLWHEFILYTKHYDQFCRHAFGRFMHHTPAVVLSADRQTNVGLRRCWWFTCREENIDPKKAVRLPLLFALDAKLNVVGGFSYVADCESVRRQSEKSDGGGAVHCGGDFGNSGFDGGTDGFGDSTSVDGGDSGGSDGGCSGGCGGGD
jgi:hypothetical protein